MCVCVCCVCVCVCVCVCAAISYCLQPHSHEVIVQGLRQGVNLKLNPDRRSR